MDPYIQLVRALVVLAALAALFFGGRALVNGLVGIVQAPVQVELDATRGNLDASKAANDAQSAAARGRAAEGKRRQKVSEEAVGKAGAENFKRAEAIQAAPAVGETDYERMVNRIDRELGLK